MSNFNSNTADVSAMLNIFVYLDTQEESYAGKDLYTILESLKGTSIANKEEYKVLWDACNSDSEFGKQLGSMVLVNQSHVNYQDNFAYSGSNCTDDPIQACAFKSPGGDLYVAYRGTGDGRWGDNGQGYVDASTDMQQYASDYFDFVVDECGCEGELYVTGHSKGGNEAQYVTLTSSHRNEISACYSFDGQGFSDDAVSTFKEDPNYESLINKMYSIDGNNDPVHKLIGVIIPEENTYYTHTHYKDSEGNTKIAYVHSILGMVTADGVDWHKDKNGQITHGKEGRLSRIAEIINKNIQGLPESTKGAIAIAIMKLIDEFTGGSIDGASATMGDYLTLAYIGLPIIVFSLAESAIIETLRNYGITGIIATVIVAAASAICLFIVKEVIEITEFLMQKVIDSVITLIENVKKIVVEAEQWFYNTLYAIEAAINSLKKWIYEHSAGFKYASANPYIEINTTLMRDYENDLRRLSERAKALDRKMNSLYLHLGIDWSSIANLGKLLRAGVVLDFAYRLDKCANYLETTASNFDEVESGIIGNC